MMAEHTLGGTVVRWIREVSGNTHATVKPDHILPLKMKTKTNVLLDY